MLKVLYNVYILSALMLMSCRLIEIHLRCCHLKGIALDYSDLQSYCCRPLERAVGRCGGFGVNGVSDGSLVSKGLLLLLYTDMTTQLQPGPL